MTGWKTFKKPSKELLAYGVFFALLAFLASEYLMFTRWPIGDDPAVHIANIKTMSYEQIWSGIIYPIPIVLFKFLFINVHISATLLFTLLISLYLFMASIAVYLFARKGLGSFPLAVAAAIFFVSNRWVNDSLRMGVFSEVFSWWVLIAALYFLAKQKVIPSLVTAAFLGFSHPIAFTVYVLVAAIYLGASMFLSTDDRRFVIWYAGLTLIALLLVNWQWPNLITKFTQFQNPEQPWGERSLWVIFTTDYRANVFIGLLSVIGLVPLCQRWKHDRFARIVVILIGVTALLSLNYRFGMRFLPFRFYSYFMIGISIAAAQGLVTLVDLSKYFKPQKVLMATAVLALLFSANHFKGNAGILRWQTKDPAANAIMLPADREALLWLKDNTLPASGIYAPYKYGLWVAAAAERYNWTPYETDLTPEYRYYPLGTEPDASVRELYHQEFSNNGVSIWQRNP